MLTWQYWESGKRPVPSRIEENINNLIQIREIMISQLNRKIAISSANNDLFQINYYKSFQDWIDDFKDPNISSAVILWRLWQSALSEIVLKNKNVILF